MPTKSETIDAIKTAFIGGGVSFVVTVVIIMVTLFAGSVWASSLAGFPFTLVMFLIAATIVNKDKQKTNFDRFLMISSALYFVMSVVVLIWWILAHYSFKNSSWTKRNWSAFGISISLWVIAVITLLVNYYSNAKWKNYLSPRNALPFK